MRHTHCQAQASNGLSVLEVVVAEDQHRRSRFVMPWVQQPLGPGIAGLISEASGKDIDAASHPECCSCVFFRAAPSSCGRGICGPVVRRSISGQRVGSGVYPGLHHPIHDAGDALHAKAHK
jgi:hypothetical protein